jgi:hypothetical protein
MYKERTATTTYGCVWLGVLSLLVQQGTNAATRCSRSRRRGCSTGLCSSLYSLSSWFELQTRIPVSTRRCTHALIDQHRCCIEARTHRCIEAHARIDTSIHVGDAEPSSPSCPLTLCLPFATHNRGAQDTQARLAHRGGPGMTEHSERQDLWDRLGSSGYRACKVSQA